MADSAGDELVDMSSLNAAKQQLRAAIKQKLKTVSHDSIVAQSTPIQPKFLDRS